MLSIWLGMPSALLAQDIDAAPVQDSPRLSAGNVGDAQSEPDCESSPNTSEHSAPVEPDQDIYVMPGTGAIFTLPEDPASQSGISCPVPAPPPVRPPALDLFGYSAVPVGTRLVPAQWETIRNSSLAGVNGPWNELLQQSGNLAGGTLLSRVNMWVNWHVRFVDDQGADTWSDAAQTLSRGFGDCEDFAIAKMALLLQLGVSADDMFLILIQERQRPLQHAVLAVRMHGIAYVLDNRTDKVLSSDKITDYIPMYSYSGPFAWTYGLPVSKLSGQAHNASFGQ